MKTLCILLLLALLLAACAGQTNTTTTTQSWSQSGYASCTGAFCRATVTQDMPQARADNTLLAAALVGVASLLLVALVIGGAA